MKLKHINLVAGCVEQDAREVQTKFSKTFTTYFFPVGEEIRRIVAEWVEFLRGEMLWGQRRSASFRPRTLQWGRLTSSRLLG